jgi:predicted permease
MKRKKKIERPGEGEEKMMTYIIFSVWFLFIIVFLIIWTMIKSKRKNPWKGNKYLINKNRRVLKKLININHDDAHV